MSASRMPTLRPSVWRPRARLQAVVDLPTPPLPEATAITFFTPGIACERAVGAVAGRPGVGCGVVAGPCPAGRSAVSAMNTPVTSGRAFTAASAAWRTRSMVADSGGSIAIEKVTRPLGSTTMSDRRPEAGSVAPRVSFTVARAWSTCSRAIATRNAPLIVMP
jgi:hypothetical protein